MAKKIHFIGDVHGKIDELDLIVSKIPSHELIFQIGDLGLGFVNAPSFYENFKFIRGNHDSPELSRAHKNYLGDYGSIIISNTKIFFIGGADSVDKNSRIENISWWRDEELNYREIDSAIEEYRNFQPEIVISHDCPFSLYDEMKVERKGKTKTNQALQIMLEIHAPKFWFYGHHHRTFEKNINETMFVCLKELETKSIIINK